MKYVLQRKKKSNIDLKALRDKSLLLRNEAQALRTNSLLLRNEFKELRAVSHDIQAISYILRTESQMLRNKSIKSETDINIDSSQKLKKESENTRKESAQIIASSRKLREELRVIKEESLQIIDRSRKLRKSDKKINDNDEEMPCIKTLNKMIVKVNEFKLTEFSYTSYINKVNEILIVLSVNDEIYEGAWLKLNELYNINALIDEFLDKIWKLATVRNRKADKKINIDKCLETDKHVDEYTNITNGKIDLFNNLGLILTKATAEVQNASYIDNDLKQKENLDIKTLEIMHETLEKVLIKLMKTISKTFKNDTFSKHDIKRSRPSSKKDVKSARKSNRKAEKSKKPDSDKDIKPDTDKDIKPDTDEDIKPDFDKDIKPDRPVNKKESNTKKATKKGTKIDVKLDIKHHIVRLDYKPKTNELQKTNESRKIFINNESHLKKMINTIKRILECFICEKFINEKFRALRVRKDAILLHSKYTAIKGFKKIYMIEICRGIISLNIRKFVNDLNENVTLRIEGEPIILKVSQTENHNKTNVSISVYNDKIINITSKTSNEQNRIHTKDINEEIECTNKVRYIILRKIMHSLFKICKKENDETNKNKKK